MALSVKVRKRTATIAPSKNHPSGRFPMNDDKHARLALQMLPRAHGLSQAQKDDITARAHRMLGDSKEAVSQTAAGQLNRPVLRVVAPSNTKPIKLVKPDRMNEADRTVGGKFAKDNHTTAAREHILAASIAANSNDMDETGRRIDSAIIHTTHSQNAKAPDALKSLEAAKTAHEAKNVHDIQRNLDTAYTHLQGLPNVLLKAKKVRESDPAKPLIETLTFYPRMIEGSFDPDTRTVSVDIISEGIGNKRDKHNYLASALVDAVQNKVFDGAQAYADHPSKFDDANRPERSVRDLIGYYSESQTVKLPDGKTALRAKLKIQEGCDWALGLVREAIEYNKKFPDKVYVGISINADGDTVPNEGVNDVTKITEAFSADMVTKPARGGRFLALVEGGNGSQRRTMNKVIEAATQLEKLAEGQEVDPETLRALAKTIREAQGDADDLSKKGSSNNKVGLDQMSEGQKTKWNAQFGEAKKGDWDKLDEASKSKWFDDNKDDDGSGSQQEDMDESKKREAALAHLSNLRESDFKTMFPTLWNAVLKEAKAASGGGDDEVSRLRAENMQLKAADNLRESHRLAVSKLRESVIPEGGFKRMLQLLVGREPAEMDSLIEAETSYLESIGFDTTKRTAGAGGGSIPLRESRGGDNMATLLSGVVGE